MAAKRRIIILSAISILILSMLAGTAAAMQHFRRSDRIRAAALNYVQRKYGIGADYRKTEAITADNSIVHLEHEGRKFWVCLDKKSTPLADTYQYDEIRNALGAFIRKTYPDLVFFETEITLPADPLQQDPLAGHRLCLDPDTVFDGTDLDAVLEDVHISLTAYFADREFDRCAMFRKLQHWNTDGAFVSFDTREHLNDFLNIGTTAVSMADEAEYDGKDILFAPHIRQIWTISPTASRSTQYPVKEGSGFLYCCPDTPDTVCTEIQPALISDAAPADAFSRAFRFSSAWQPVHIYIPIENLPQLSSLCAVWTADSDMGKVSGSEPLIRCGEYAEFTLSKGADPSWMLTAN